jgi:hypothetical protein
MKGGCLCSAGGRFPESIGAQEKSVFLSNLRIANRRRVVFFAGEGLQKSCRQRHRSRREAPCFAQDLRRSNYH